MSLRCDELFEEKNQLPTVSRRSVANFKLMFKVKKI